MNAQALTIIYSNAGTEALVDPYWIRIEPVELEDDTATISQTASLLDTLYGIDPCTDAETETTPEPAVEEKDFSETVSKTVDLSFCKQHPDGSVEMQIKVIRSHLAEPYRLQLQGGEVLETIQLQAQVVQRHPLGTIITLEYPVVSGFSCSPEPLARVGNTLRFADSGAAVQTITATYQTIYDLVTIKVLGVKGEPGECRCLAFCHGLVTDETIKPPAAERVDRALCPKEKWQTPTSNDQVTCYTAVTVHQVCSCSKTEINSYSLEQVEPCPEGIQCSNNATECMHLLGSKSETEYIDCGPADRGGNYNTSIDDPEFYREKCCVYPGFMLPHCVKQTLSYRGDKPIVNGEEFYRGLYGPNTRIMPVPPEKGICGEWEIIQRVKQKPCCEEVPPMTWDVTKSATVITKNGHGIVAVRDGIGPFAWHISSARGGVWFTDSGGSNLTTDEGVGFANIMAGNTDPCGPYTITVIDSCDTLVTGTVMGSVGGWVELTNDEVCLFPRNTKYPYTAFAPGSAVEPWRGGTITAYHDEYKIVAKVDVQITGMYRTLDGVKNALYEEIEGDFLDSRIICFVPSYGGATVDFIDYWDDRLISAVQSSGWFAAMWARWGCGPIKWLKDPATKIYYIELTICTGYAGGGKWTCGFRMLPDDAWTIRPKIYRWVCP